MAEEEAKRALSRMTQRAHSIRASRKEIDISALEKAEAPVLRRRSHDPPQMMRHPAQRATSTICWLPDRELLYQPVSCRRAPADAGGATSAIIVYYTAQLPIGLQIPLQHPLLMAAWKTLGHGYTVDVIIGTGIFSLCLDLTRFLNAYAPVNDLMLAAIFGGVFWHRLRHKSPRERQHGRLRYRRRHVRVLLAQHGRCHLRLQLHDHVRSGALFGVARDVH